MNKQARHDLVQKAKEIRYVKGEGLYVRTEAPQVHVHPNGITVVSGVLILVEPEDANG